MNWYLAGDGYKWERTLRSQKTSELWTPDDSPPAWVELTEN